ncbi:MAG: alpha/beta hydrolase [Propionibacterium sp.]|nr:alpha/beta hydrolase [Propionibacterium sp.]
MTPRTRRRTLTGALVATLVLTGCATGAQQSGQSGAAESGSTQSGGQIDGTVQGFYSQQVSWKTCTEEQVTTDNTANPPKDLTPYQCATLVAPLDWDDPAGETVELSIARHLASGTSQGALFYNLGGPGGAAVNSLALMVTDSFGEDLVKDFDLVALDPRGVGASTPVVCMTDEERDRYNEDDSSASEGDQTPDQIIAQAEKIMGSIGQGCLDHSGDLARHIDTVSAAKDFDMARAALGQETMNYLGYSYGTFLGATYAGLFPDKVGRFVLDGALDPSLNVNQVSDLQMRGFEDSLAHWIEDCQAGSACPLSGGVEGGQQKVSAFLDRLAQSPLQTSDPQRPLTQSLARTAILGILYNTANYSTLTQAMQQAMGSNDGSMLLFLADYFNDRNQDGTYASNGTDALLAINSLDYEPAGTPEQWQADAEKLQQELPVLGAFAGYSSAGLSAWPIKSTTPRTAITAPGTPPIVVVGTTHDPATPYVMAQGLAEQLEGGVLVSWEGWNHTAYSKSGSRCVAKAVEGYLVDGTVPEDGLRCTD